MKTPVVRTVAELRETVGRWRKEGGTVGLVPTMGGLHEGHLSLARMSVDRCARTVGTIFVNPKQFGPSEDFSAYPRREQRDLELFGEAGVDLAFAPAIEEVYPEGFSTQVRVDGLGDILEGECRPGFFTGVATVVTKLLTQTLPDTAFFGEKDYQQLKVISRLVRDLDLPVEIIPGETVREADGLAMSSRNVYLSPEERRTASALYAVLNAVSEAVAAGENAESVCERESRKLLDRGFDKIDYLTVRDAETLMPWPGGGKSGRILGAAHLGGTRLIDNIPLPAIR